MTGRVAVVGGGLAGITCALALADAGEEVQLFEHRARLGGATWSFERNGRHFDNGQHVYLRCCTAYQRLLERLGTAADAPLRGSLDIPVLAARAGSAPLVSSIRRSTLPAPLHLGAALLGYKHLSARERLGLAKVLPALLHASPEDPALEEETFGAFLARHGQSSRVVERLFDLIVLPTTNLRSSEVAASVAVKVFRTGLLDEAAAGDIGWASVPLGELHGRAGERALEQARVRVELRAKVEAVELDDAGRACGLRVGGSSVRADAVVVATGHEQAQELLPPGALESGSLAQLGSSPIIDVHVVFDRRVFDHEIAAALDSPVQYLFDRSDAAGVSAEEGQCLAVSVSGADEEHGERPEVLIDRYVTALRDLLPGAREARVLDAVVSREHHATFRATPGSRRLRPTGATKVERLLLAGAYTDTGWPATMEGAVRSGTRAAWHARRVLGEGRSDHPLREAVA